MTGEMMRKTHRPSVEIPHSPCINLDCGITVTAVACVTGKVCHIVCYIHHKVSYIHLKSALLVWDSSREWYVDEYVCLLSCWWILLVN